MLTSAGDQRFLAMAIFLGNRTHKVVTVDFPCVRSSAS